MSTTADRYTFLGRLGAGGMATVFLAEDTVLGRKVAIKRLATETAEASAVRFRREAKMGASLNHPNLVSIYDTYDSEDGLFIVMEYVEGEHLGEAMRRGPLGVERSLAILRAVAAALDHAHRHGVVHRDVKPANILLGTRDTVKVADLGIAVRDERITTAGAVLGTLSYLAPELLSGADPTPAVDIYALAAVAFEMLGGQKARGGDNALAIASRTVNEPPPDIRDSWPEAPAALAEALGAGLCRDPAGRPESPGELVRSLQAALEPAPAPEPEPEPEPARAPSAARPARPDPKTAAAAARPARPAAAGRSRRAPIAAALLLLAAVVVAVVLVSTSGGGSSGGGPRPATTRAARPAAKAPRSPAATESPAASSSSTSPAGAVRGFYGALSDHKLGRADALLTANARSQLGTAGVAGLAADLKSIVFSEAVPVSTTARTAKVRIATMATHDSYVDHCRGKIAVVKRGAAWLVDRISVDCSRS